MLFGTNNIKELNKCQKKASHFRTILKINNSEIRLLAQYPCKYQWRHNGGIRLHNKFWCIDIQFSPGNFFIGHRAGVGAIRGG